MVNFAAPEILFKSLLNQTNHNGKNIDFDVDRQILSKSSKMLGFGLIASNMV
jgi:hypothetical protein